MQANLERERFNELCRLHEMVDVLQQAVEDAEVRVIAEREAALKAIAEAPPVIKEKVVLVEDTEKVNSSKAEVERLKVCLALTPIGWLWFPTFSRKKSLTPIYHPDIVQCAIIH